MSVEQERAERVLARVREDPDLTPAEKETTIRFAKDQDLATIYTEEAGIARRILAHPHATVQGVSTLSDGGARANVSLDEVNGSEIVGVRARIPVGALKILKRPRKTGQHAPVVSDRVLQDADEDTTEGDE